MHSVKHSYMTSINELPIYLSITFIAVTLITVILFYLATHKNNKVLFFTFLLMTVQATLSLNDFFMDFYSIPPRFPLAIIPSIIGMVVLFSTSKGRVFIDSINLKTYTYLHSVRVAVEIVIIWLFLQKLMPQSMTFEGHNFDILSGLTAPVIACLAYNRKILNKKVLLIWNVICLILVLQVVGTGVVSIPSVIQQTAFDQPNVAVLIFPFIWLPGIVVPIVVFGHLVAIRQILKIKTYKHDS